MNPRRKWCELRRRAGRRGERLRAFAVLAIFYGVSLFTAAHPLTLINRYFKTLLPLDVWATMWIAVGIVAAVYGFRQEDRFGWVALDAMIVVWAGLCMVGWLTEDLTIGTVAVWGILARLLWVDATDPGSETAEQRSGDDRAG